MTDLPRRPLRICHIAYTFYESDNRVMRYVQTLAKRGDKVDVVALRPAGRPWREANDGVCMYQIQRRATTEKGAWTYLLKLLWFWLKSTILATGLQLRRRYDVVHVHNVPDFLVFGAWLPKLMGARIILDIHDIVPELYAGKFNGSPSSRVFRLLTTIERICCSFADHVIVSNDLWHDKLTSRSVPASKCSTFMNYPDLSVFKPTPARKRPADSPFLVLYPGSLNHHQGVDIAVRAFALVRREMPGAVFHIYGRGPALTELIGLTHDLGLDDSVRFMKYVSLTRLAEVMASASVGVIPKRSDGFGNEAFSTKILEFMGCEVPVIVSRTRIDEYYFNDRLVNFFEAGSATSLADVLLRTYRHPDEQHPKVRAAKEFATQRSWQVRSADYRSLIDSLVTRSCSH
jgi:glycosyltransferase involved in cell wall biosynthesis